MQDDFIVKLWQEAREAISIPSTHAWLLLTKIFLKHTYKYIDFNFCVWFTHLWDFLPSVPPGPEPQSWAWMMKVYSFCNSQSTRPCALSWPSPDVPFNTTASNGASSPWMLNAQISPGERNTMKGVRCLLQAVLLGSKWQYRKEVQEKYRHRNLPSSCHFQTRHW